MNMSSAAVKKWRRARSPADCSVQIRATRDSGLSTQNLPPPTTHKQRWMDTSRLQRTSGLPEDAEDRVWWRGAWRVAVVVLAHESRARLLARIPRRTLSALIHCCSGRRYAPQRTLSLLPISIHEAEGSLAYPVVPDPRLPRRLDMRVCTELLRRRRQPRTKGARLLAQ
jgi:hypothetical protein